MPADFVNRNPGGDGNVERFLLAAHGNFDNRVRFLENAFGNSVNFVA